MNYKIEKEGTYKGFDYFVIAQSMGYRCGYVAIEKNHKLYEKNYNNIDFNVHGGLTFSNFSPVDKKDRWLLGFDCAHFRDARDESIMSPDYLKFLKEHELFNNVGIQTIRPTEYVENECKKLIDQIIEYK